MNRLELVEQRKLPSPNGGGIRVLVADDHRILREGLSRLLEEQPDIIVIDEASDGQMAVEKAVNIHPDVVVMDVGMPLLNGIEATRRILVAVPDVRVIGLSMHEETHMAAALKDAGAVAYLRKDCPIEMLLQAIRGRLPKPEVAGATR